MKSKRPNQLPKNASKLHKYILNLLISEDSIFKNYNIKQEYNVNLVNPEFPSGREKYDLVILELQLVLEIHGRQHFDFISHFHETKYDFRRQQERDEAKKQAAIDAGWAYVVIKYNESKITSEELIDRIQEAIKNKIAPKEIQPRKPNKIQNNNKLQSREFQKPPKGYKYKWPKRKINN